MLVDEVPSIEVHDPPDPPEPAAESRIPNPLPKPIPKSDRNPSLILHLRRRRSVSADNFGICSSPSTYRMTNWTVLLKESRENTPAQGVTLGPDYQAQDWRPMLPSIDLPVLITTGGRSGAYPGCKYMFEHIPGARMEVFEDSGHALFYEEPDRFNAVVAEFIDGLHAESRG